METVTSIKEKKLHLRRSLIDRRRGFSADERRHRSDLVWERCRELRAFAEAAILCSYIGYGEEVETAEKLRTLLQSGRRVAVPTLRAKGREPAFSEIHAWEDLTPNSLGILEPSRDSLRLLHTSVIPLFLVPGIAFDRSGGRLGYGLGFYDRALKKAHSGALLIGLAFDIQIVDRIPVTDHDIPMDLIITDSRVITTKPCAISTEEVC